jgi:hypothetical protein
MNRDVVNVRSANPPATVVRCVCGYVLRTLAPNENVVRAGGTTVTSRCEACDKVTTLHVMVAQ